MSERDHLEESLHYLMINVLVDSLERDGFSVLADHVGDLRGKPAPLGGEIPDIEARRGDEVRIIEVETQSTLDLPATRDQLRKMISAYSGDLHLAIPFDCIDSARRLRDELGLGFVILPCYPFVRYVGMPK